VWLLEEEKTIEKYAYDMREKERRSLCSRITSLKEGLYFPKVSKILCLTKKKKGEGETRENG